MNECIHIKKPFETGGVNLEKAAVSQSDVYEQVWMIETIAGQPTWPVETCL